MPGRVCVSLFFFLGGGCVQWSRQMCFQTIFRPHEVEVLFPCIAFSNFRAYSWELLGEWYMAGVGSFLTMVLGALLGKCGALLLRLEPPYSKIFILCTTFGNATWIFWSSRSESWFCVVSPWITIPQVVLTLKSIPAAPAACALSYAGLRGT